MKNKILWIFLVIILIITGYKIHILRDNYIIEEEIFMGEDIPMEEKAFFEEEYNGSIEGVLDLEEVEAVFTYSSLTDGVVETIEGKSYKENSKIGLEDLAYLNITYWGFDEEEHIGEIIVNEKLAEDVLEIFKELYEAKFPIEKIRLIDEYDADDGISMLDNNSSAFCYREIGGSNGKLSNHSYGIAIDINPVQNPYVKNNIVLPESGREYLDRTNVRKGMIVKGDLCYQAFIKRGWTWGGEWKSLKDYQHFEFKLD